MIATHTEAIFHLKNNIQSFGVVQINNNKVITRFYYYSVRHRIIMERNNNNIKAIIFGAYQIGNTSKTQ